MKSSHSTPFLLHTMAGKWLTFAKRHEKHIPHLFPKVITRIEEIDFRNFVYAKDEEYLSFLPKEPSLAFGTGSPSVSVNIEPLMIDEEPGGSSRPPVKRKLAPGSLTARATRAKTSASKDDVYFLTISDEDEGLSDVHELKDATACHLNISNITPPAWKNHLDNYIDLELLDLHDYCYARQAFVDNVVNKRSCELLGVIEKLKDECDEKISTLSSEAKEHKANLDRMMLESQKYVGYQANLSSLESQVVSLEAEKARLEAVKVSLRKEVDDARWDRMEVVSKVVPYVAMELIHSDDLGSLVGKLVTSAIVFGRCKAFEQVALMKEPFDLTKVKGYHSSYKKDHNWAGNDLAIVTFPWLSEFVADPLAPVEVLLSKKPPSIQKPASSKT
nr:hypothetical protein [Tanacetum cinerariifolium]